jgi:hypothetical protein
MAARTRWAEFVIVAAVVIAIVIAALAVAIVIAAVAEST